MTGSVPRSENDKAIALSSREEQILGLAASGLSDQEIGRELGISGHTLQTYWKRIRAHLGKTLRSDLVAQHIRSQSAKVRENAALDGADPEAVCVYLAAELRRSQAAEQKAGRALKVLRRFFTEASQAATEQELLHAACEVLVESGGYLLAWFGVPIHDEEQSVRPVARYPASSDYVDKIRVSWGDNAFGHGPAGRALRLGEMEVGQDFLVNPTLQAWFTVAQEYDFQSILALPIRIGEEVVMVLTVYAAEPDAFDIQERELLKEFGAAFESRLRIIRESPLSEARLRAMIAEAPFAIRVSRDDITTYVNQAFVDMFELAGAESILGHHVGEIWTPETRDELIDKVARRPDGIPAKSFEGVALLPTNRRIHVHVAVKILDLAEGRTAVAYLSEVKPPEFSRRVFDLARIGGAVFDLSAEVAHVSAELAQLFAAGDEPFDIQIEDFRRRFYHPDDLPMVEESAGVAYAAGEQLILEFRAFRADGVLIWIRVVTTSDINDRGEPVIYGIVQDITERKRAEEALVASEYGLKEAQRLANIGNFYLDARTDQTLWSEEMARIVGWDPTSPAPTRADRARFYTPESFKRFNEVIARGLAFGEPYDVEVEIVLADGVHRHAHARGEAVRDENGAVVGLRGTLQDITERKQAEVLIATTLEQLKSAQRLAHIGSSYWDIKTDQTIWSEELFNILGWDPSSPPHTFADRSKFYTAESFERLKEAASRALSSGESYVLEVEIVRRDGVHRQCLARGEVVCDDTGTAIGLRGTLQDITERKNVENALVASETELKRAQEVAALGSWSLDLVTGNFMFSDQLYRILGLERGEIEPNWESVQRFIHPEDLAFVEEGRARVSDDPQDTEFRIIRKDGQIRNVLARVRLQRDSLGNPLSTHGILLDITEQKSLKAQLLQAQKMEAIGQLTGGIAHDFNNFLTVVLGCSELLAIEFAGDPRLSGLTAMIQTAAKKGAVLTHQMLAFGRRQALQPRPTNINQLLDGMTTLLHRTLRGDIDIAVTQAEEIWTAIVDPVQVESAILNLCLNGRDAMPNGGRLTIETSNEWLDEAYAAQHADVTPGPFVGITVTDTGDGIPPENIGRIFDPFFTTKEAGKGTGLGLSMVFGFVKQSRGHVKIYSEVGIGTAVRIYLPRDESDVVGEDRSLSAIVDLTGTEKILLVEDDPLVLRYAEEQLSSLGYKVISASNGKDALSVVQGNLDIDLLFTDMVMPGGMNGRQLAEEVAKIRPTLKILFTSGYTENFIRQQGEFYDSLELLNKPYTRNQLGTKIRTVLDGD